MQVSEGLDTFEFRSPHGMKAAHSRLRTFAGIAVRHLQHFNHPGRAWHDLSGPQDILTVVLAEIGGRCEARQICIVPLPWNVNGLITSVLSRQR